MMPEGAPSQIICTSCLNLPPSHGKEIQQRGKATDHSPANPCATAFENNKESGTIVGGADFAPAGAQEELGASRGTATIQDARKI